MSALEATPHAWGVALDTGEGNDEGTPDGEELGEAAPHCHEAVGVNRARVARVQPSSAQGLGGAFGPAPISLHAAAPDAYLPNFAGGDFPVRGVKNPNLLVRQRAADGAQARVVLERGPAEGDKATKLALAVTFHERKAEPVPPVPLEGRGNGAAAGKPEAQSGWGATPP